jgi:FlaG/FlaF family flagellin (archaellin)
MSSQKSIFLKDTSAVSEVIGEVLMTAIAVLAFAVIAVFILSYASPQEKVHADVQGWVSVTSDTVYLRHAGGQVIDITKSRMVLSINGTRRDLTPSELEHIIKSTHWKLGETIIINTSELWGDSISQDDHIAVTMVNTDSNLVIKSGTLLGDAQNLESSVVGTVPTAPVLSAQDPSSPYVSNISESVTFSASSSQSSINHFLLNGQHLAWSNGTYPSYTNISSAAGTYNLTLIARNNANPLLTDSITWTWTVVSGGGTIDPVPGLNMRLQKPQKGGYISDGDYMQFRTGSGTNTITVNGVTTSIGNNRNVRLVMNGQQTSGEADIGISGASRTITTYDFNVSFYVDGSLVNTGTINNLNINKADNFESTLTYYLPSHLSPTYFSENGNTSVLINLYPPNASEIRLYNITPASGANFMLEFNHDYTSIDGFDALYTID